MSWQTSGLHTIRLDVTDNDGATSSTNERWVNIRNVPPVVQPLDTILPIAEGQSVTITGNSTDTPSDLPSLTKCWDVDPGIDSDGRGGASDDCDTESFHLRLESERIPIPWCIMLLTMMAQPPAKL